MLPPNKMVMRIDLLESLINCVESVARPIFMIEHDLIRKPGFLCRGSCSNPDPLDFPLQFDTGMLFYPFADGFAQGFDVARRGLSSVDKKIAVHFRYLRAADAMATHPGGINQFPGTLTRRILERRATGLFGIGCTVSR